MTNVMPIDTARNQRLGVVLTHETVRRINVYRAARGEVTGKIPSQSTAVAELVEAALQAFEKERPGKPPIGEDE